MPFFELLGPACLIFERMISRTNFFSFMMVLKFEKWVNFSAELLEILTRLILWFNNYRTFLIKKKKYRIKFLKEI